MKNQIYATAYKNMEIGQKIIVPYLGARREAREYLREKRG